MTSSALACKSRMAATTVLLAAALDLIAAPDGTSWPRHAIDRSSRGADGVRLADVNGDGLPDITTGWEEGGRVRVYVNPGPAKAREPWPAVTVGKVASPEDAVFADLDGDGTLDVLSSCEGKNRTAYAHWAPAAPEDYLSPESWRTEPIPATQKQQMWMFALPFPLKDARTTGVVLGSKGKNATVGWLTVTSPEAATWQYGRIVEAGWIMSLQRHDLNGDGLPDALVSDRKGSHRGVYWLQLRRPEHPEDAASWQRHDIAGRSREVMFLAFSAKAFGRPTVVTATRNGVILFSRAADAAANTWTTQEVPNPFGIPHGKAVAIGDVDGDGLADLVYTANTYGDRSKPGVAWLQQLPEAPPETWPAAAISGPEGVKFDRIELLDLDGDGDLDVLTCEERDNLGVIWYENPHR